MDEYEKFLFDFVLASARGGKGDVHSSLLIQTAKFHYEAIKTEARRAKVAEQVKKNAAQLNA